MKSFTKVFIALFIAPFLFFSCGARIPYTTTVPHDPIIKITGCDKVSGNLTLSDNGETVASRANVIFWEIEAECISEIIEISMKKKRGNKNVFVKGDPSSLNTNSPSLKWRGRINPHLTIREGKPKTEFYNIIWRDTDGNLHTYDPTIKVNQ